MSADFFPRVMLDTNTVRVAGNEQTSVIAMLMGRGRV
jgi:hypothetical protein